MIIDQMNGQVIGETNRYWYHEACSKKRARENRESAWHPSVDERIDSTRGACCVICHIYFAPALMNHFAQHFL